VKKKSKARSLGQHLLAVTQPAMEISVRPKFSLKNSAMALSPLSPSNFPFMSLGLSKGLLVKKALLV